MRNALIGVLIGMLITLAACDESLNVKAWFSRPDLGGIFRGQKNELMKYSETAGYICYSGADHTAIQTAYRVCKEELKKCQD